MTSAILTLSILLLIFVSTESCGNVVVCYGARLSCGVH